MKPYVWHARVYYEDTDAGGVVYYANYLKFMERARTEWLRSLGVEQDELAQNLNVLFAVRSVSIKFKQPARFNDSLTVTVEPFALKPASVSFKQAIMKQSKETNVLTSGEINVVCLRVNDFSPQSIPKNLFKEIKKCMLIQVF